VPGTWETWRGGRTPGSLSRGRRARPAPTRVRLYRLARSGQGFLTGVALGVLWALWIVRRRRPGPDQVRWGVPAGEGPMGPAALDPTAATGAAARAR
jgi:hypothetical protein